MGHHRLPTDAPFLPACRRIPGGGWQLLVDTTKTSRGAWTVRERHRAGHLYLCWEEMGIYAMGPLRVAEAVVPAVMVGRLGSRGRGESLLVVVGRDAGY